MLVAIPLGLGAAIYLAEYARPRVRKTIKPILELLAGVPTIVFGYFALTFFTPEVLRGLFGLDVAIFNALAGGIIIGFLIIPTVASISEDAMSAVPQSLREGAFGLGASSSRCRCAWSSRPRCRASSPRSCSASRARSARRWSC